jgi:hypothetical protein
MATVLLWAGLISGMAGLFLWNGLGLAAMLRDPRWTDAFTFSISRAMDFQLRAMRAAGDLGRRTGLGRIANILFAIAVTCLMAAGITKVISLIVARQGGAA